MTSQLNANVRFLLLGKKGFDSITGLNKKYFEIISGVVIGEDKNLRKDYSNDILEFCKQNKINCEKRDSSKSYNDRYLVAIGWRWIIDTTSEQKLFVFHDSLLPKYRGFNPLVTALINGDRKIGMTCLYGHRDFDAGDILYQRDVSVRYPIKIDEAINLIGKLYKNVLNQLVHDIRIEKLPDGIKQSDELITYSVWRDHQDYFIDWSSSASEIERFVNAVGFPYEGAKSKVGNQTVVITDVEALPGLTIENNGFGKVLMKIDGLPIVVCGKGALKIKSWQNSDGGEFKLPVKLRYRFE